MATGSSEEEVFENDLNMNGRETGAKHIDNESPLAGLSDLFTDDISLISGGSNTRLKQNVSDAESDFLKSFSADLFIESKLNKSLSDKHEVVSTGANTELIPQKESDSDSDISFNLFDDESSDDDGSSYLVSKNNPKPGSLNTNCQNAKLQYEERETKVDRKCKMFPRSSTAQRPSVAISRREMGQAIVKDIKQEYTGPKPDDDNFCCICMDEHTNPKTLKKCSHSFCTDCIDEHFKIKPTCPVCFTPYGVITGNQPHGHMSDSVSKIKLPGYEGYNTIVVSYSFNDGIQTREHPNPGQMYYGTGRTAYLPNNAEGQKVLKLLKLAFKRRLTFTVGRSRTTGCDNVVTWNDIHHKTSTHGGQQCFGYPDPTYLRRVQEELAAVGVTEESLKGEVL